MEETDDRDFWSLISAPADPFAGVGRVLVLAPHPDDEALGCGGTVALYASKGMEVRVAVISDGGKIANEFADEDIDIVAARKEESLAAAGILGIRDTYFLGFPDGQLNAHRDEITARLDEIVRQYRPDIVFAPSLVDFHEDHIAVSEIALGLLVKPHAVKVAFYEVYETIRFNTLVDISDVMDAKEKAVLCYRRSLFRHPEIYAAAAKALNRFRSFYTRADRYYEALLILSRPAEKEELLQWLTYAPKEDGASLFLSRLKVVDELLFEMRKCHDTAQSHEAALLEHRRLLESREKRIVELQTDLDRIREGLFWKMAVKFYGIRDRLLPAGSQRRRAYERITGRLKAKPQ